MDSDPRVEVKPGHWAEDPEKIDMRTILTRTPRVALRILALAAALAACASTQAQDEGTPPPSPAAPGQEAPAVSDDEENAPGHPENASESAAQEPEPAHTPDKIGRASCRERV